MALWYNGGVALWHSLTVDEPLALYYLLVALSIWGKCNKVHSSLNSPYTVEEQSQMYWT